MLRSAQALNDLLGHIHQAWWHMSIEVALAVQTVTHTQPKLLPHSVKLSKIGAKFIGSFDLKEVFSVITSQRVTT